MLDTDFLRETRDALDNVVDDVMDDPDDDHQGTREHPTS